MYPKAANMIHIIRQVMDNDSLFRNLLRGMNETFYHKTVTSNDIETYINKTSGKDFTKVFDQYLRTTQIPVLRYKVIKGTLFFQWTNCVKGFNMPLKVTLEKDKYSFIYPTEGQDKARTKLKNGGDFKIDPNFYVRTGKMK